MVVIQENGTMTVYTSMTMVKGVSSTPTNELFHNLWILEIHVLIGGENRSKGRHALALTPPQSGVKLHIKRFFFKFHTEGTSDHFSFYICETRW